MRVLPGALLSDRIQLRFCSWLQNSISTHRAASDRLGPRAHSAHSVSGCSPPVHAGAATRSLSAPATPPVFSRFHQFNLWENAIAASCAGAVTPLHPVARINSARPLLFSDDALSSLSLRCALFAIESGPANEVACSAASLLYPKHRVARVSRLIGKSDTTLKTLPWQVAVRGRSCFAT